MRSTKSDREVLKRVTSTSLHWSKCHLVRGNLVSSTPTPSDLIPLAALPISFVHVFPARRRIMRSDYSCTSIVEFESYFPRIFSHGYWFAIALLHFKNVAAGCVIEPLFNERAPDGRSRVERSFKFAMNCVSIAIIVWINGSPTLSRTSRSVDSQAPSQPHHRANRVNIRAGELSFYILSQSSGVPYGRLVPNRCKQISHRPVWAVCSWGN